jgi:hypothetical protein
MEDELAKSWKNRFFYRKALLVEWVIKWGWHWPTDAMYWHFPEEGEPYLAGIRTGRRK